MDIKGEHLIKQIKMEGLRKVGDPNEHAKKYADEGIDEILYVDAVASLFNRNALIPLLTATAKDIFVPITVAGGIRSIEDARALFNAGADKVAINTQAIKQPELITQMAEKFGSQSVVVQIDVKLDGTKWVCWTDGGREPSNRTDKAWAKEVENLGAGEILLTSIDQEGTRMGFRNELIAEVAPNVNIPVVASSGMGKVDKRALAASLDPSRLSPAEIRQNARAGIVFQIRTQAKIPLLGDQDTP